MLSQNTDIVIIIIICYYHYLLLLLGLNTVFAITWSEQAVILGHTMSQLCNVTSHDKRVVRFQ
jgi:hypothetical protein